MKRIVYLGLLSIPLAFGVSACKHSGDHPNGDHPKATGAEQSTTAAEPAKADHPTNAEHPTDAAPKSDHPDHPR